MWLSSLYVCLLLFVAFEVALTLYYSDLNLQPVDPLVEEGGVLVFNCTIEQSYRGPYNYTSIYFYANKKEYRNGSNIEFVAPRSAVFTRHNVTIQDAGHFTCCLPDRPIHTGFYATQNIVVIRRPLVPVLTGCVINSWQSMTCRWEPTAHQQIVHTRAKSVAYHLRWRQQWSSVWYDCPILFDESCKWNFEENQETIDEHLVEEEFYCVQVIASNSLQINVSSTEYCFEPSHIVMLNPIHFVASSVNASHGVVSWTTTDHFDSFLVFDVSVVSPWQSEIVHIEVVDEHSTTIEVIPFTNYTVSVKVKANVSIYWSLPSTTTFQSQSTIPLSSPAMHSSSFRIMQVGHTTRRVMIYWKSLQLRDYGGPDLHYVLTIRNETSHQSVLDGIVIPGNQSSTEVVIDNNDVHGTLLSCNKIGCTKPMTVIRFPVSGSSVVNSLSSILIIEGANQTVILHLHGDVKENVLYTVFWCRVQPVFGLCYGDIEWRDIPSVTDQYILTVNEDYKVYMFGLAASLQVADNVYETTGIQWMRSVYSITGLANPPKNVRAGIPSNGAYGELLVTWTHPGGSQGLNQGYIKTFDVFYCELNASKHCTEDPSRESVQGSANSYLVTSLKHGVFYKVWMNSVTRAGSSFRNSTFVSVQTAESLLTAGVIIGVVVGILVVVFFFSVVIFAGFRYCQRLNRKFSSGIAVRVPSAGIHSNSQSFVMNNLNSAPVIEYSRIVYSRQGSRLSNSSRDSGHFGIASSPSVSPQNGTCSNLRPQCETNKKESCSNCSSPTTRTGPYEPCGVMYINNEVQSPQQYQLLHSGYDRLVVQSAPEHCTAESKLAPHMPDVKDKAPGLPVIRCSSSSSDNVADNGLTVGLLDVNRDSGYVQHDEWLNKVLGVNHK